MSTLPAITIAAYSALRGIGPVPTIPVPPTYDEVVNALAADDLVVSYYKLASSPNITDQMGVQNGGVASGLLEQAPVTIADLDTGGKCLGFNGTDSGLAISYTTAHKRANGGISVLVQPDDVTAAKQIVVASDASGSAGGWSLEILAGGQVRFYLRDAGNAVKELRSTTLLEIGTAYQLAATWGAAGLKLYVDGVLEDTDTSTAGANNNTTSPITIGRWHGTAPVIPTVDEPPLPSITVPVTTSTGLAAINAIPADRLIQFAAGTYSLGGAIVPKSGQYYRGNPSSPASVVLQGTGNFRAFTGTGDTSPDVVLSGLTITGYQSGMGGAFVVRPTAVPEDAKAQIGAIENAARWHILDCRIVSNYCTGIRAGNATRIARCVISDNGHVGILGGVENNTLRGRDMVIEDCTIQNNCRFLMNFTWDSGGIKFIGGSTPGGLNPALNPARNNIIRRCVISGNGGPGIWFDWECFDNTVHNCSIYQNHCSGVVIEASASCEVYYNQIGDNCTSSSLPSLASFRCNTVACQNSKKCRLRDNLFYVNRHHASVMTQHNRSTAGGVSTPKGGVYVGWFTATENVWSGNVWLLDTNGAFLAEMHAHSCSNSSRSCTGVSCSFMCGTSDTGCNVSSSPSGPTVNSAPPSWAPLPNMLCFIPPPTDDHFNAQTGDTMRIASGTANRWSFATGITQLGNPSGFVPTWTILPTWTTPPGKT